MVPVRLPRSRIACRGPESPAAGPAHPPRVRLIRRGPQSPWGENPPRRRPHGLTPNRQKFLGRGDVSSRLRARPRRAPKRFNGAGAIGDDFRPFRWQFFGYDIAHIETEDSFGQQILTNLRGAGLRDPQRLPGHAGRALRTHCTMAPASAVWGGGHLSKSGDCTTHAIERSHLAPPAEAGALGSTRHGLIGSIPGICMAAAACLARAITSGQTKCRRRRSPWESHRHRLTIEHWPSSIFTINSALQ